MKTKWIIIPMLAITWGCIQEIENNGTLIEGEFTLYASSGEQETRTVLQQDGKIWWSPSDCINVYYGNKAGKFTSVNTEARASAEFKGSLGSFILDGDTEFVAVYPYSEDMSFTGTTLGIILPSEQIAVEGSFAKDLFISVAKSRDLNLHFYNVCGGVKFSLARDDIKKVVFKGNNKESLAGRLTVEFDSDGIPVVPRISSESTTVTLSTSDGSSLKSGSWYFIALAPKKLSKGFTMELYSDELVDTISSESLVTVRRSVWGVIKSAPSLEIAVPEAIDMGLPSGLKWASFNLGATKPEEYGDYFAWGETKPYYKGQNPFTWESSKESGYDWPSYIWCSGSSNSITKYYSDDQTVLESDDDAAFVNLGDKWRMPTEEEIEELRINCTISWDTQGGVGGFLITSNIDGFTDNHIFIPAAGMFSKTNRFYSGESGFYWSASNKTSVKSNAGYYTFSSANKSLNWGWFDRCYGLVIRPVYGNRMIPVQSISLDNTDIRLAIGETTTLNATVYPEDATYKNVTWSSNNDSVASVLSTGVVTGVAEGSAIITATDFSGGKTATCNVTVQKASSPVKVPDAVDLGLPSGLKWASFNLGATKPEEYGDYYAWGETEPYYSNQDPLTWKEGKENGYAPASYKWMIDKKLTKYCTNRAYGYQRFVDDKTVLEPEDDAAFVALRAGWRMPTRDEMDELWGECSWDRSSRNGIDGYTVTGPNGNSIFLPFTGFMISTNSSFIGERAYYWLSSLYEGYPDRGQVLIINSNKVSGYSQEYDDRYLGNPIRPVYAGTAFVAVENVTLDKSEIELSIGGTTILTASILPDNATNKSVTWTSSNASIATVSSLGVVTGVGAGAATITVTTVDGGRTASCTVTVKSSTSSLPVPEIVDLGLSIKWASFNLGATKPEEEGNFYAWGETETKESFSLTNYKWSKGTARTLTKYCTKPGYGYNRFTDNKTQLDPEDDAARVNLGGGWRMPTVSEIRELEAGCDWSWMSLSEEVEGYQVASRVNGNSIFLPVAGYMNNSIRNYGSAGYYWSSSLYTSPVSASIMMFYKNIIEKYALSSREVGLLVRPVYGDYGIAVTGLSLGQSEIEMTVGQSMTLNVTIIPANASIKSVFWRSDDSDVATISSTGVLTGLSSGSCTITARSADGDYTASCTVVVK